MGKPRLTAGIGRGICIVALDLDASEDGAQQVAPVVLRGSNDFILRLLLPLPATTKVAIVHAVSSPVLAVLFTTI